MKISKKKIEELREAMKIGGDECYGTEEVIDDAVTEILIKFKSGTVFTDEIGLTDGDEEFATLDDFVREFWDKAVDLILNFISSKED